MKNLQNFTHRLDILYVEDDPSSRKQLTEVFSLLFHSVTTAIDGQDAFTKYKNNTYDIVITDINMPFINGIELIKKIKQQNKDQHIIIISAHNDSYYLLQAIELGIDSFIIKPLQIQQLKMVLKKVSNTIYMQKIAKHYQEELEKQIAEKTAILQHQFITDELTGLYNRNAFLHHQENKGVTNTILLMSIDNYDSLLITYGYDNCDFIIQEVASFLQTLIPDETLLYRLDNHDFAFLTPEKSLTKLQKMAKEIQNKVLQHEIHFSNLSTRISISIALAQGETGLLKKSHMALKEAQKAGKNRLHIYQKDSPTELLQRKIQQIMPQLKRSIESNNIFPYFQAIINNETKNIEKYECLARIIDDEGKVHSPADFIDVAELTGMLSDITRIMIDKSFKAFQNNTYHFSINISEHDLNDGYLREYLQNKCHKYNIKSSRVTLEVLEGVSIVGAKNSLEQLMNLKQDGFLIAIDDFGVQNSNFERVHSMQVDYIKIDGSFIKNIHTDTKSYHVVKTINDFGKSIDAKIIAEYVHSKEVHQIVTALGIEYSQGYYFAKPSQELH